MGPRTAEEAVIPAHHKKRGRHRGRRPREDSGGPKREHVEELHPVADPPAIESFAHWDLGDAVQGAIAAMSIEVPTPIQALAIGHVLDGKDVIAKAETGTGKTLAFGAPMIAKMDPSRATVLGLVICPTRELAQQVADVLEKLGEPCGVRVALVVGGDPLMPQVKALRAGAQVVVGTPGRILDLCGQRFLSFPWTEYVVLDEADKMFEIGFLDDVRKILDLTPAERNTLLFSATFPTEVLKLARSATNDPIEIATAKGTSTVESISQGFMKVDDDDKPLVLTRMLEQSDEDDVFLIFCERRTDVDRLMRRLERTRFAIKALHGGYDQEARYRVMGAFRTGDVKAMVATDVAARGLDVDHVTHVINFAVPRELEDYTHRIGRTGRAGRTGTAITFVSRPDFRKWQGLMQRAKWEVDELDPPERTRGRRDDRRGRDGGRGERPRRERAPENAPPEPPPPPPPPVDPDAPAFGAIDGDEPAKGEERRRPRRRRGGREREREREERPAPETPREDPGGPAGFGAGL